MAIVEKNRAKIEENDKKITELTIQLSTIQFQRDKEDKSLSTYIIAQQVVEQTQMQSNT